MTGPFARLRDEWFLRGWTDLPRALVRWGSTDVRPLTTETFYVVQSCDGETDFGSMAFLPQHRAVLRRLVDDGVAEWCSEGHQITPPQHYRLAPNPQLSAIDWSVTGRCNLKCRHCFMESPSGKYGALSTDGMVRLIDQFERANVLEVTLTGGEPFLRPDLLDLVALLAERRIWLSQIYSNGLLIRQSHLDAIRAAGFLPAFQVSFDGVGTHDAMRGVHGVEGPTVDAMRLLTREGFPVVAATSIDVSSAPRLLATYALMRELGVAGWRVSLPQPIGNWRSSATGLSLREAAEACRPVMARWVADGRPFDLQLAGFFRGTTRPASEDAADAARLTFALDDYDCRAVRARANLLPDATLVPCPGYVDVGVEAQMPNLLSGPGLSQAWTDSAIRRYADLTVRDVVARNPECATCEHLADCGTGCRAAALAETGDRFSRDPVTCKLTRAGYRTQFMDEDS